MKKSKRAGSPRCMFICSRCDKTGWTSILGVTECSDCRKNKNKHIEKLQNGKWLEWITNKTRKYGTFLYLDLYDRSKSFVRQKNLLHFVWNITTYGRGITLWFGGMVSTYYSSNQEALKVAEQDRERLANDIKQGIYREWVEVCPVCNVNIEKKLLDPLCEFGKCPQCNRIWLVMIC